MMLYKFVCLFSVSPINPSSLPCTRLLGRDDDYDKGFDIMPFQTSRQFGPQIASNTILMLSGLRLFTLST